MSKVHVVVRHRRSGHTPQTTRLSFDIPENIDPANMDSFIAATVHHTASAHAEEHFGVRDPLFMNAFRMQVITGLLERALNGHSSLLARRILRVLRLNDSDFLAQHSRTGWGEPRG